MNKILHITAHLGGGVGKVVLNYLRKTKKYSNFTHTIASLDYINGNAKEELNSIEIEYEDNFYLNYFKLLQSIQYYDIVLIHWWNHPLMYELLVKYTLPESRVIMWSHISGLHKPSNFTKPLFKYADKFIFTTPISFKADIIKKLPLKFQHKLSTIWATGGLKHVKNFKRIPHQNFNVGYIGTVDYSKLHNDFLDLSNKININSIQFIVCGGEKEKYIEQEAIAKNINKKFKFTGKVNDIKKYLSVFDVFGYPLSAHHYGTCDQALAEAMACGVVPVVFNNPMENNMIEHNKTGLIVKTKTEYKKAIKKLYKDKHLRNKLSNNAQKEAFKRFSLKNMTIQWEETFKQTLSIKKTPKKWEGNYQGINCTYLQIFLESTGDWSHYFEDILFSKDIMSRNQARKKIKRIMQSTNSWDSQSKGTINHYLSFFKDNELDTLNKILNNK